MRGEGPKVGGFRDHLVDRLACPMPGAGLDAGKTRHGRDIFERVAGHHAVMCIARGGKRCRVILSRCDVVIGRIGQQIAEIFLHCGIALLLHPHLPAGELVEPQHVQNADSCKGSRKQVGALLYDSPDQKPAVGFALNGQPFGRCDPVGNQKHASRDEIIEYVLLVQPTPGVVPRTALFAAAADIGDRNHATLFDPRQL